MQNTARKRKSEEGGPNNSSLEGIARKLKKKLFLGELGRGGNKFFLWGEFVLDTSTASRHVACSKASARTSRFSGVMNLKDSSRFSSALSLWCGMVIGRLCDTLVS